MLNNILSAFWLATSVRRRTAADGPDESQKHAGTCAVGT